jgi:hypothetical protein
MISIFPLGTFQQHLHMEYIVDTIFQSLRLLSGFPW